MPSKCYESHLKSAKWPTSTIWSWSSTVSRVSGPGKNSPSCGRNPQSHTLFSRTRVLIGLNIPRSSRVKLGKQFSFGFALCYLLSSIRKMFLGTMLAFVIRSSRLLDVSWCIMYVVCIHAWNNDSEVWMLVKKPRIHLEKWIIDQVCPFLWLDDSIVECT